MQPTPAVLYHGTPWKNGLSIKADGCLDPKYSRSVFPEYKRLYFSETPEEAGAFVARNETDRASGDGADGVLIIEIHTQGLNGRFDLPYNQPVYDSAALVRMQVARAQRGLTGNVWSFDSTVLVSAFGGAWLFRGGVLTALGSAATFLASL